MTIGARLIDPTFWTLPLDQRMAELIPAREAGPFVDGSFDNLLTGETEHFTAVVRHAELCEISRRARDFCSGKGATALPDLPTEMLDFFGGVINMDASAASSPARSPRSRCRTCSTRSRRSAPR